MACEPVDGNHPDPFVNEIEPGLRVSLQEILLQSADSPERIRMIEHQKVFRHFIAIVKIDLAKSFCGLSKCRWIQPRARQKPTERVDIATVRRSAKETGLDDGCSSAHERVVSYVAWFRKPLDEETRQLRFEARPVGYLVQAARGALSRRPKLVDVCGNRQRPAGEGAAAGLDDASGLAEVLEIA